MIYTLTGPSCSGKTTLVKELVKTGKFEALVGFTTRPPRAGEIEGQDYFFLSPEQAQGYIDRNAALEHVSFNGHLYGILVNEVERAFATGKIPVCILNPHGKYIYEQKVPVKDLFRIYVEADLRTLVRRFLGRFAENPSASNVPYESDRLFSLLEEFFTWKDMSGEYEAFVACEDGEASKIVDYLVKGMSEQ
jgi:guanylate kinase